MFRVNQMTSSENMYNTSFCHVPNHVIESLPFRTSKLRVNKSTMFEREVIDGLCIGEYQYSDNALFGVPVTFEGEYIYDFESELFGVMTQGNDLLSVYGIFDELQAVYNECVVCEVSPEETHQLYNDLCYDVESVVFADAVRTRQNWFKDVGEYHVCSEAKLRAQATKEVVNASEYVNRVVEDAINNEKYVIEAPIRFQGQSLEYVAPTTIRSQTGMKTDLARVMQLMKTYFHPCSKILEK